MEKIQKETKHLFIKGWTENTGQTAGSVGLVYRAGSIQGQKTVFFTCFAQFVTCYKKLKQYYQEMHESQRQGYFRTAIFLMAVSCSVFCCLCVDT